MRDFNSKDGIASLVQPLTSSTSSPRIIATTTHANADAPGHISSSSLSSGQQLSSATLAGIILGSLFGIAYLLCCIISVRKAVSDRRRVIQQNRTKKERENAKDMEDARVKIAAAKEFAHLPSRHDTPLASMYVGGAGQMAPSHTHTHTHNTHAHLLSAIQEQRQLEEFCADEQMMPGSFGERENEEPIEYFDNSSVSTTNIVIAVEPMSRSGPLNPDDATTQQQQQEEEEEHASPHFVHIKYRPAVTSNKKTDSVNCVDAIPALTNHHYYCNNQLNSAAHSNAHDPPPPPPFSSLPPADSSLSRLSIASAHINLQAFLPDPHHPANHHPANHHHPASQFPAQSSEPTADALINANTFINAATASNLLRQQQLIDRNFGFCGGHYSQMRRAPLATQSSGFSSSVEESS